MQAKLPHADDTPLPSYVTPAEIAAALRVSRGTVAKLLRLGRQGDPRGIKSITLATQVVRVPRSELLRLIEAAP